MATDWDCEVYNAPQNIPGDPDQVGQLGKNYRDTADAIKAQASNIRNLVNGGGWDSDSGREFQDSAGKTADKLEKAYSRYDAAASALGTGVQYPPSGGGPWAESLAHAQDLARAAIRKGQDAQHAGKQAQTQIDQATAANGGKPDTSPGGVRMADTKSGHDADMLQAEQDLQAARDFRDAQANKAADAIVAAYKHDGLKDSWWDKAKDVIEDIAVVLGHWAGVVASIFGVLALIFSWVPIVGEVFAAIAAVASVVALVCDVINALDGNGTWLDVGIDVLGVLSCGSGRLLGDAAKGAKFLEIMKSTRGLGRGLRLTMASEKTGVSGMKAARAMAGEVPAFGKGARTLAYAKAAVNPKLYLDGMKDGREFYKTEGLVNGLKQSFKPASFPQLMGSGLGNARQIAWGTVPVALGWANLGAVKEHSWGNDTNGLTTPDVFGDWKKDGFLGVPMGANGVGSDFKTHTGGFG
jgi:hypothetical protein